MVRWVLSGVVVILEPRNTLEVEAKSTLQAPALELEARDLTRTLTSLTLD